MPHLTRDELEALPITSVVRGKTVWQKGQGSWWQGQMMDEPCSVGDMLHRDPHLSHLVPRVRVSIEEVASAIDPAHVDRPVDRANWPDAWRVADLLTARGVEVLP